MTVAELIVELQAIEDQELLVVSYDGVGYSDVEVMVSTARINGFPSPVTPCVKVLA